MQCFTSKKSKYNKNEKTNDKNKENIISIKNESNHKHLICDDSEINRLILKKYLDKKNIICDEASDGIFCIEKIVQNGIYDILWLDIQMPRMNGLDCAETLRKKHNYKGTIIGLTGYIDQMSVDNAISKGMNHVIGKPINKDILYSYVEKYTMDIVSTK